ncbi:MAG: PDC sensor domain-containing protein [Pseudomonadota bacterium]
MEKSWKDSIYLQREQLGRLLHDPLAGLADQCAPAWGDREALNRVLLTGFASIPHCKFLYCVDTNGIQICDNVDKDGLLSGHYARDRSQRPYMNEAVPVWGFLLSDAYISLLNKRPSLTALQIVRQDGRVVGYLGADFDLRDLPANAHRYQEPSGWRQIKGDPSIRGNVMHQCRVDSPMDKTLEQSTSILEELMTERGVFQAVIHFSSSRATVWTLDDPYRYRILDQEALADPDICLVYPPIPYPAEALVPKPDVPRILETLKALRMADENIYLRMASINLFNGMISLTFSCDGSHYMRWDDFLAKNLGFWFGTE